MAKNKDIFILAKYTSIPKNRRFTCEAGYIKNPDNMIEMQQLQVTSGLQDRDLVSSKIVLNMNQQKVVRNDFKTGESFVDLFGRLYSGSPEKLKQALFEFGIAIKDNADEEHEIGRAHV